MQIPETMKLFGSAKKLIEKTNNGENASILKVVEVVLVQFNIVENTKKILRYYILLRPISHLLIC